jgi:endo-1,4-beta-mannosidase
MFYLLFKNVSSMSGVCSIIHRCTVPSLSSTTTTPSPAPTGISGEFVSWDSVNMEFKYNSRKFVPVGFNAYWLGITEEQEYPAKAQVEEIFKAARDMGATVIRSHTLGISSGSGNSLRQPGNIVNEGAWDSVDYAFSLAKQYNIKLICPMLDAYYWYNGNYGDFSSDYGIQKESFFTDRRCIDDFKEYLSIWLNHRNSYTGVQIKDSPEIFAIETGNEFNLRPENNAFPPKGWLVEISEHIKSIDQSHMILHGTDEPLGQEDDFNINTLDIFTGHFYGEDYDRIRYGSSEARSKGKPYIIGEASSKFEDSWYRNIEAIPNMMGTFVWSMYPHLDGTPSGSRIPHEDGYTIWYDTQTEENTKFIETISNHFQIMKNN